jgi:hypothetical protein
MSSYVAAPTRTFAAGGALKAHRRVKLSSGKLAYAGSTDVELGTLETDAFADGDPRAVRLRTAEGTVRMVAAGAIAAEAEIFAAADGKVDDSGTVRIGIGLTGASGDGSIIEVLRD